MPSLPRSFILTFIIACSRAATIQLSPALRGAVMTKPDLSGARTDVDAIWSAIEQKARITHVNSDIALVDPPVPDGYEFIFGPTNAANIASGDMGFTLIDEYDVSACATLCTNRGADPVGGVCQYFNIWTAIVNGTTSTHTCNFYYTPTNESTAINFGQGDLTVTASRGYRRESIVIDGGFEGYTCKTVCWTESYENWIGTSPPGGVFDATIYHIGLIPHSGGSFALLGSNVPHDTLPGTITPTKPLVTVPGKTYIVTFFQSSEWGAITGPVGPAQDAFVDVLWNGVIAITVHPGFTPWTYFDVTVTAKGNDTIAFRGGKAPLWTYIDDIGVFAL